MQELLTKVKEFVAAHDKKFLIVCTAGAVVVMCLIGKSC